MPLQLRATPIELLDLDDRYKETSESPSLISDSNENFTPVSDTNNNHHQPIQ